MDLNLIEKLGVLISLVSCVYCATYDTCPNTAIAQNIVISTKYYYSLQNVPSQIYDIKVMSSGSGNIYLYEITDSSTIVTKLDRTFTMKYQVEYAFLGAKTNFDIDSNEDYIYMIQDNDVFTLIRANATDGTISFTRETSVLVGDATSN